MFYPLEGDYEPKTLIPEEFETLAFSGFTAQGFHVCEVQGPSGMVRVGFRVSGLGV